MKLPLTVLLTIWSIYLPHVDGATTERALRALTDPQREDTLAHIASPGCSLLPSRIVKVLILVSVTSCIALVSQTRRRTAPRRHTRSILTMVAFTSTSLALLGALWPSLGHTAACAPASSGLATTTTTSWRSIFTVPSDADQGQNILPNVKDPQAINVQDVCPGYKASGVTSTANGFTANLDIAGPACNVYGNDIANLTLSVEYQAADRVNIHIQPRYIGYENETWFILPESIIPRPGLAAKGAGAANSDLEVTWTNEPTFSFTVTRKSTSDVLFTTNGSVLVYADQFIEFASQLPEDYNLYGLGEVIHGFRLGNNLTSEHLHSIGMSNADLPQGLSSPLMSVTQSMKTSMGLTRSTTTPGILLKTHLETSPTSPTPQTHPWSTNRTPTASLTATLTHRRFSCALATLHGGPSAELLICTSTVVLTPRL